MSLCCLAILALHATRQPKNISHGSTVTVRCQHGLCFLKLLCLVSNGPPRRVFACSSHWRDDIACMMSIKSTVAKTLTD